MKQPRRLSRSGGVSQRLLDSASLDKPSQAARRHADALAATANSFTRTSSGGSGRTDSGVRQLHPAKTLATWIVVGAAASVALGLIGSKLFDSSPAPRVAAPLLSAPAQAAARSPDISAEPATPAQNAPQLAPAPSPSGAAAPPSAASLDEAREIAAASAAISRGDDSDAIATLNGYDEKHPNGELKPEAMALRIQALSHSGKTSEARTLVNEFQGKYPKHPLVRQVSGSVPK
jgi:TolA-binding protein